MFTLPLRWAGAVYATTLVAVLALPLAAGLIAELFFLGVIVGGVGVGTGVMPFFEERSADHNESAAQIMIAGERERVARDVHDVLGHSLTVISLKAELAERQLDAGGDTPAARAEVCQIHDLSRQALVRGALAALLGLERDLLVVAQVGRGDEVLAAALRSRAQVALVDVEMPGTDGIEACRELSAHAPGVRSLVVTRFGRPGYLRRAMDAGANPLTDRERSVLREALAGSPVADIAQALHLSPGTVRNYLSAAIGKTHTATRAQAAATARDRGWL